MRIKKSCLLLFLSLSLFSFPACYATDLQTSTESTGTVSIPKTQWEELKRLLNEQEMDLTSLKAKLQMLKGNSTDQLMQLEKLQNQLNETKESLTKAQTSLQEARADLNESKKSLETLKAEIKSMEHKQIVQRRQRDTWAGAFSLAIGGWIYEVVK